MSEPSESSQKSNPYRHLPILSLLLVLASLALLIRMYLSRPGTAEERRMAAISTAIEQIPEHFAGEVSSEQLYRAAMRGMVRALHDPYSTYLNRHQLENMGVQTRGEFGGIGVIVSPRNGGAVIVELQEDGPAEEAGLQPGDIIVGVDDEPAGDLPFVQLVSLIRGKVGTTVQLLVERAESGKQETIPIQRARISTESVAWRRVEEGIGYIQIRQFDDNCLAGVKKALEDLQSDDSLSALLLDVRGNTGGLLEAAVGISDLFLSSGNIVRLDSRLEQEQQSFSADEKVALPADIPLAILADHRSASASEVLAGALQAHGRATVIGTRTFGKGAVNRVMPLPDRSGLLLTVAHYTVGDGKTIHKVGVEPDIVVGQVEPLSSMDTPEKRRQWLRNYQEAQKQQLRRAVEFLKMSF